ncbi:MAG: tetratricopeptide repeat protein [Pseudomonadota bacterium]|jgi:tetratricopeptide (TPR) repeat protein
MIQVNLLRPIALACVLALAACAAPTPRPEAPASDAGGATDPAAVAEPPESEDKEVMAALMAGEFAWQDGRTESAARHYARAAAASDDPAIAEHATRVAIVARTWELARTALARWRVLAPEATGIVQAEAALALADGDTATALARLRALLQRGDAEARRMVGQALLGGADPERATAALEALAADTSLPGGVDTLLALSQVAQQLRQPALAGRFAAAAVAAAPDSAPAVMWKGHLALRGGDRAAARAAFERALAIAPADRSNRLTYAALLNETGEPGPAADALAALPPDDEVLAARAAYAARAEAPELLARVAAEIEALPAPRPAARLELLGQLAELAERREDALRWYRAVPRGERWFEAQVRIAVLLDGLDDRDGALAHLDALRAGGIDDDARLADTFLLEAELHDRHADASRALDAYSRGLRALPDERRLLYARALAFERLDRVDECIADLRRLVELDPDDADALNALGYTLADRTDRHQQEALELITRALAAKPDEPAIIDSMGWVQYRLGNHAEALVHLRRAFELQPDAEIAAHLGEVLWVTGARDEARAVWARGREVDTDNDVLAETVRRLDR